MKETALILKPYRDAVVTLEEVLSKPKADDIIRDAAIQRFEYCFELAWKLMKRVLERDYTLTDADRLTKKDLFRQAQEVGLIADAAKWFDYLDARNRTTHEYSAVAADAVYGAAKKFFPDAKIFLAELEKRYG